MANFLSFEKEVLVLNALVEGNSVCSILRMTGVNKRTILRLLFEAGKQAEEMRKPMELFHVIRLFNVYGRKVKSAKQPPRALARETDVDLERGPDPVRTVWILEGHDG